MYSDNKSFEDHQMKNERHLDVQSLLTRRWHHRFVVRQNKKKMEEWKMNLVIFFYLQDKKYLQREQQFFLNIGHKLRHLTSDTCF